MAPFRLEPTFWGVARFSLFLLLLCGANSRCLVLRISRLEAPPWQGEQAGQSDPTLVHRAPRIRTTMTVPRPQTSGAPPHPRRATVGLCRDPCASHPGPCRHRIVGTIGTHRGGTASSVGVNPYQVGANEPVRYPALAEVRQDGIGSWQVPRRDRRRTPVFGAPGCKCAHPANHSQRRWPRNPPTRWPELDRAYQADT